MSHESFLESMLTKSVLVLVTLYLIGVVTNFTLSYTLVAGVIVLVISLVALYYMVAGGYRITDSQIQDTLSEMRG